tara:strand:+ start:809 stop:1156 length:348 start_codon:yes stop_codon:yes gene_type:complete
MTNKFDNLSDEQSNLVVLKVLCILEDKSYCNIYNWPLEDISIDDLYNQINKVHSDKLLNKKFIDFCSSHIEAKKQYSLIEGLFNLIKIFEELERYEDCIVLKNIKDNILLELQYS